MDPEFSFGQWIKRRRQYLGLRQETLAEQVGYSAAMMRKIENDERRPSPGAATLLAKVLEIPQDQQDRFLKFARQERTVHQLVSEKQGNTYPWLPASQSLTNLPLPATLFIGREVELAKLNSLLQDPDCRLITLVGLAGIGKTRLAVQVAHIQLDRFPHGVYFVSLAPLCSSEMIIATIANAINFRSYGSADPQEQLLRYLQDKCMLLLLDNFEHLIDEASLLPAIMQAAPAVKLLVTSRERLNLQGEWVFELEGLPYPEEMIDSNLERTEAYGAVQLFSQSALRINPSFRTNEENREWVVRICQILEGMPLGIELAAASVRVLSCREIAREIESNIDFLKASTRDIPERHKSLKAALDHSWELLPVREKEVFPKLSVFRGGFRREAAQQVMGAGLQELTSLRDKSLLKRVGEERYDLHEIIRQYGAAILESNAQEHADTFERHCEYFIGLLESRESALKSSDQLSIVSELSAEIDNIRVALSWAIAHAKVKEINRSAGTLFWFFELRNWFQEGMALFDNTEKRLRELEQDIGTDTGIADKSEHTLALGQVLTYRGLFCMRQGQHGLARDLLNQSITLLRPQNGDINPAFRPILSDAITIFGVVTYVSGNYVEGSRLLKESLAMKRALGDRWGIAICLRHLGLTYHFLGENDEAYRLLSESLAISREIGNPWSTAFSLNFLSTASYALGKYTEAQQLLREGHSLSKALGDTYNVAYALNNLGRVSCALGEYSEAQQFFRDSIALSDRLGDRGSMAQAINNLGNVMLALGDHSEARLCFLNALETAWAMQLIPAVLDAVIGMAAVQMQVSETIPALELLLFVLNHPNSNKETQGRAREIYAELKSQLTHQQIEATKARAQLKTLENVVEELRTK